MRNDEMSAPSAKPLDHSQRASNEASTLHSAASDSSASDSDTSEIKTITGETSATQADSPTFASPTFVAPLHTQPKASGSRHGHAMPFGASLKAGGGVRFALWAPADVGVALQVTTGACAGRYDAVADAEGWRVVELSQAVVGDRYQWAITKAGDAELRVPDPASRDNPEGALGPSAVVDPQAFEWGEAEARWRGRPWADVVAYELHVGTFTPEGSFEAAEKRLPQLAELGITCIQLMPVASFPGRFGWGYDGVLPYAPQSAYGPPQALKRFIQAAHRLGLMVMLDVVYNHFGPEGNYLSVYAPQFFTDRHHNAWGDALNFDGPGSRVVREFFIHNALYWIDEYRFDGLRLDAVHAMKDDSSPDILQVLAQRVRAHSAGRQVHLVLENDCNEAARLRPGVPGGVDVLHEARRLQGGSHEPGDEKSKEGRAGAHQGSHQGSEDGRYDGQWSGDFHHTLHVLMTGEHEGYYGEYVQSPRTQLARCLTHGFAREGAPHLEAAGSNPRRDATSTLDLPCAVNFVQTHDQIGNRAFGDRLAALVDEAPRRLATALLLLSPTTPMLFMGEEFAATSPFLFFADWSGPLRDAVVAGRRREFAQFTAFADEAARERIPDPCAIETFQRCKLDFDALAQRPEQADSWRFHQTLLALRQRDLAPRLTQLRAGAHESRFDGTELMTVLWRFETGRSLELRVNLGPHTWHGELDEPHAEPAWFSVGKVGARELGAWSACWHWRDPALSLARRFPAAVGSSSAKAPGGEVGHGR